MGSSALTSDTADCPNVPDHPQDVSIDANITQVLRMKQPPTSIDLGLPKWLATTEWWCGMVCHDGAPWDYKTTRGRQYDALGNFNYGATGAALGFPQWMLLGGADLAKLGKIGKLNQPEKQQMIMQGIKYYQNHCGNF